MDLVPVDNVPEGGDVLRAPVLVPAFAFRAQGFGPRFGVFGLRLPVSGTCFGFSGSGFGSPGACSGTCVRVSI